MLANRIIDSNTIHLRNNKTKSVIQTVNKQHYVHNALGDLKSFEVEILGGFLEIFTGKFFVEKVHFFFLIWE